MSIESGEADKTNAAFVQASGEIQEVFHAAAKSVQLPHDKCVSLADCFQCPGETGRPALVPTAGRHYANMPAVKRNAASIGVAPAGQEREGCAGGIASLRHSSCLDGGCAHASGL